MLWVKSLHIVFMVGGFAGLFYLPRPFVYHPLATDAVGMEQSKTMERRLYFGIMAPSAVLTIASGLGLWLGYGITGGWRYAKRVRVAVLVARHFWPGKLMRAFARDRKRHGDVFYRWSNEIPAAPAPIAIVLRVVLKPS